MYEEYCPSCDKKQMVNHQQRDTPDEVIENQPMVCRVCGTAVYDN